MNVGRQVDGKIRMQNAADAAAYSGGVVLARGMNTLAFTNHLLCDVFANTALMREARDRNSESYVPSILAAWNKAGRQFSGPGFPKFQPWGRPSCRRRRWNRRWSRRIAIGRPAVSDADPAADGGDSGARS